MKILQILSIILLFAGNQIFSQDIDEELLLENKISLHEGIFINFEQVKANKPIDKNSIVTNIPINAIDFYKKLTERETIAFFDENGEKKQIDTKHIWGFCENNHLYINYNGRFYKIPSLGRISQFIAKVKVMRTETDPMYSGYYNMATRTYEYEETHHFLLSFDTGQIYEYNYKNVERLISSDKKLYEEFSHLRKRMKKKLAYKYIMMYNKRNPLKLK